jgi:hypothetical protein
VLRYAGRLGHRSLFWSIVIDSKQPSRASHPNPAHDPLAVHLMMRSRLKPLDPSLALAWNQTKLRPSFMMGPATIEGPGGCQWDRGPRANALALMLNVGCQSQCESASTHHVADSESEAGNVTAGWEAPFKLPHAGSYQPPGTGGLCIKRKCQRRGWFQGKCHRAPERKVRSQMAAP